MISSDANRASHCCFAAATERETIHRGNDRLAEIFDQIEDILSKRARFLRFDGADLRELINVGARDECFIAGSSQDDAAHGGVILCILERGLKILPRSLVQSVEDFRPIESDIGNRAFLGIQDSFEI